MLYANYLFCNTLLTLVIGCNVIQTPINLKDLIYYSIATGLVLVEYKYSFNTNTIEHILT